MLFGELSVLSGKPRGATVRAVGPTRCIRIGVESLNQLSTMVDLETDAATGGGGGGGVGDELEPVVSEPEMEAAPESAPEIALTAEPEPEPETEPELEAAKPEPEAAVLEPEAAVLEPEAAAPEPELMSLASADTVMEGELFTCSESGEWTTKVAVLTFNGFSWCATNRRHLCFWSAAHRCFDSSRASGPRAACLSVWPQQKMSKACLRVPELLGLVLASR